MRTRTAFPLALTALLLSTPTDARAQAAAQIESQAMAALQKMGGYLRTLKAFQVDAVTSMEDVLEDGQKVTFGGETSIVASMPDRLRISIENDRRSQVWLFNGKEFTVHARRANYYATVPAPATIALLADVMDQKYDMQLPLEDLFRWGGPQSQDKAITSAMYVGPSVVNGVSCGQFAFRQDGLDWQVWIQAGDYPLPRKLVLTTRTDEARPQYVATFDWNLAPSFNDEAFTFVPPAGASKIMLAAVE